MSILPTINKIERWDTEELIKFLSGQNLRLIENHFEVLRKQFIDGSVFLELSQEDLERWEIPGGVAKRIMGLVNKIKVEAQKAQEAQEAQGKYHDCIQIF